MFRAFLRDRDAPFTLHATRHATRFVLLEAARNLEDKVPEALSELNGLARLLEIVAEPSVELESDIAPLLRDPDDVSVLAGAIAAHADIFVTGDRRHFGHLYGERVRGVLVLGLRDALSLLTQP